ncbi:MAG: biotin/lipoyl-binding protein [Gammaproteobacteria bacterium]
MLHSVLPGLFFLIISTALTAEEVPAVLDWAGKIEMGSPLSGRIAKVMVSSGQQIKAGSVLLQLERGGLLARREALRAKGCRYLVIDFEHPCPKSTRLRDSY